MKWSNLNLKDGLEYICVHLRKYYRLYSIICFIIAALELFMSIRFIYKYPIEMNMYLVRFILYVILFLAGLFFGLVLLCDHSIHIKDKVLFSFVHVFALILIIWGAINSYVDIHKSNDIFTFITIIVMVGGIVVVHPVFFVSASLITTFILVLESVLNGLEYFDNGAIINLTIFMVLAFIMNYQRYSVGVKEYKLQKKLLDLSYYDQLTGVYNRRTLFEKLEKLSPDQEDFFVGMLDVDNFKSINDLYGHNVGDDVVSCVASIIKDHFGAETTFRYGGDEFTVFGFDIYDENELVKLVNDINLELSQIYQDKHVTISAGFCINASLVKDYMEIVKMADNALYISKNDGKSTTTILKN